MKSLIQQIANLWSELGLNQKISLTLTALVIMAATAALVFWSSRPRMQLLYGGLDASEMGEVVEAVKAQGVPYQLESGGTAIFVPGDKVYTVRMELAAKGLPNGGGVGFEIFDRGNFGISDFIQKTNYLRAVQGELARTVSQLRGVRKARVMVVMPENRLLQDAARNKPTASVFVDTGGARLDTEAVNSIRFLVSNAVQGLNLNDVAVVDNNGKVLSEQLATDATTGAASGQFRYKKDMEAYYTSKIESLLRPVVGDGNVVARVAVEIGSEQKTVREEKYDPNGQVVRNQTTTEDATQSSETVERTPVGVAANGATAPDAGANGPRTDKKEERKNKTVNYEINRSVVETVQAPGAIRHLSAAVFVARRTTPPPADAKEGTAPTLLEARDTQELNRIRQMVVNALGLAAVTDKPEELVTVEEVVFSPATIAADMGDFDLQENVLHWYDSLRSLIAVAIAVIMFVVFLRMIRRQKSEVLEMEVVGSSGGEGGGGADATGIPREVKSRITPDLLNELIEGKPENVSTALKNWIIAPTKPNP